MTDNELVDEIERRIVENAPLADILRMFLLLGGRLNSEKLQEWAKDQLDGYAPEVPIPDARIVGAPIYVDAIVGYNRITGQHVSAAMLPAFASEVMDDTLALRQSIPEIESMIDSIKRGENEVITLSVSNWEAIGHEIDKAQSFQHTQNIYRRIHVTELEGIVADARNRTAELLGELRKTSKGSARVATGRRADEIVNGVVVSGSGNSIIVAHGNKNKVQSGAAESASSGWWGAWGKAATIVTVVVGALAIVVWLVVAFTGGQPPAP
jgi:hypothetical protein